MQVNSINNNSQPSFKAYISNDFYVATEKYFQKIGQPSRMDKFEKQMDRNASMGDIDTKIFHKRILKDNKPKYALVASKGDKQVILSTKDQFRKLIEKFMHINEYEFNLKTKDLV